MKRTLDLTAMKTSIPLDRPRGLFKAGLIILLINLESAEVEQGEISHVHQHTIRCGSKEYAKSAAGILLAEEVHWIQTVIRKFDGSENLILDLTNDVAKTCNPDSLILLTYLYAFGETFVSNPQLANQLLKTISTISI
ncbi:hypothetical protein H7X65_00365 [Candidatus Parcubacteria bacterium]|nr:hypothetical protein [Candidatus Parcubacteria bacterium]